MYGYNVNVQAAVGGLRILNVEQAGLDGGVE